MVEQLTQERTEMEEAHGKEIDEITEAGVNEIQELEAKIDEE